MKRRKTALMLVIQPPPSPESLYWQSLGNPPGDARDCRGGATMPSGSYFVTASPFPPTPPRDIARRRRRAGRRRSALTLSAIRARAGRYPLQGRDKFSHFDIPLGAFQRAAFVFSGASRGACVPPGCTGADIKRAAHHVGCRRDKRGT